MEPNEEVKKYSEEIENFKISDKDSLEQFRIRYLGSKNVLKKLFGLMGKISAEERPALGKKLNELKEQAEKKYEQFHHIITAQTEEQDSDIIDYTRPGTPYSLGGRHPVALMMQRIISIFKMMGFVPVEEREIEDQWHNFSALNTPDDHPARDMQDTYYLQDSMEYLLRTHTSNVQIRTMSSRKPPMKIIAPGRVYRNETISSRSHCQFHQVEGFYINKDVSFADLKKTLYQYAREMYGPDTKIRLRPSYFPFTEPSAEMDIYWGLQNETDKRITKGTGWLEVLGCGMIDPQVLENCNINPEEYSGYAFGMGIERQIMLRYYIDDIRKFFENDVNFLKQFTSSW